MNAKDALAASIKTIESTVKYDKITKAIRAATLTLGKYHITVEYSSAEERDIYVKHFESQGFKSMKHWGDTASFSATLEWYPKK